jgi:L-threonylcarbamoyladenylate synthase
MHCPEQSETAMPAIITIDPNNPDPQALREAAAIILQGGIAIYPTETVYGIGVRYDDAAALQRLFDLKERGERKPVLLLLPRAEDVRHISSDVPPEALLLAKRFWPGPLTLVVPARPDLCTLVTAGSGSVGCRVSSSAVAAGLVCACGLPITSTSANLSGGPNPSSIADIPSEVIAQADIILDAGPGAGTLPSTVYDVSQHPFCLVRPGLIAEADITNALADG